MTSGVVMVMECDMTGTTWHTRGSCVCAGAKHVCTCTWIVHGAGKMSASCQQWVCVCEHLLLRAYNAVHVNVITSSGYACVAHGAWCVLHGGVCVNAVLRQCMPGVCSTAPSRTLHEH